MDNRLLGIRREQVTDLGAVIGNPKAVNPMLPDGLSGCVVIGIALEIFDPKKITCREAPYRTSN